ncbi:MAG: hypothetical protein JMDDDDMK_01165 [Acidobacteria bacterium]|nr:hypothetical protein [Acidobacteriota bacterium]
MPLAGIVADQVIAFGLEFVDAADLFGVARADGLDAQNREWGVGSGEWVTTHPPFPFGDSRLFTPAAGLRALQNQRGLAVGQKHLVAVTARKEPDRIVGLPLIHLEVHRQSSVLLLHFRLRCGVRIRIGF